MSMTLELTALEYNNTMLMHLCIFARVLRLVCFTKKWGSETANLRMSTAIFSINRTISTKARHITNNY